MRTGQRRSALAGEDPGRAQWQQSMCGRMHGRQVVGQDGRRAGRWLQACTVLGLLPALYCRCSPCYGHLQRRHHLPWCATAIPLHLPCLALPPYRQLLLCTCLVLQVLPGGACPSGHDCGHRHCQAGAAGPAATGAQGGERAFAGHPPTLAAWQQQQRGLRAVVGRRLSKRRGSRQLGDLS